MATNELISSKPQSQTLDFGGCFELPFNGRVQITFDVPNSLLEKVSKSRIDSIKLFDSVCASILFDVIAKLTQTYE
jgi:hypothetical protein